MTGTGPVPAAALRELRPADIPVRLTNASSGQVPGDPFAELDQMTGLASVKHQVRLLAAEASAEQLRRDAGLPAASRFPRAVHFPAYTNEELTAIFTAMARDAGLQLADGVTEKLHAILAATPHGKNFGNARHARNLLEQAISAQALRITRPGADRAEIRSLRSEDLPEPSTPAPDNTPG